VAAGEGEEAAAEDEQIGPCAAVVGVVLPMRKARAAAKAEVLRVALASALGLPEAAVELVAGPSGEAVASKVHYFCAHTSAFALRKQLEGLSLRELRARAAAEWRIPPAELEGLAGRDGACDAVVRAFVRRELRTGFEHALQYAGDPALSALLALWGVPAGGSRAEREALAAEALDSEERWEQVADWVGLYAGRIQGRTKMGLDRLMAENAERVEACRMQRGEVLASHLYTGPSFVAYNCLYRSFPPHMVQLLAGDAGTPRNTLPTTLFCISSSLVKLGRQTNLPDNCKVFRGLGRMLLPSQFWVEHGSPAWKGGVERAIMSTTSDKDVAMHYSGGKGMIVEIGVGRIQIGGDVGWVSMVCPSASLACARTEAMRMQRVPSRPRLFTTLSSHTRTLAHTHDLESRGIHGHVK
jgi:hypothetical protein